MRTLPARNRQNPRWRTRLAGFAAALFLLATTVGCAFSELLVPPTPTPVPTRQLAPTFTPTPEALLPLVVVTPPRDGTPGVIVIQPTIDADRVVIAIPPTDTPQPTPTETPLLFDGSASVDDTALEAAVDAAFDSVFGDEAGAQPEPEPQPQYPSDPRPSVVGRKRRIVLTPPPM